MVKISKNLLYLIAFNALPAPAPYKKVKILKALGGLNGFVAAIEGKKQKAVPQALIRQIKGELDLKWAEAEIKEIEKNNIKLISLEDEKYPALLSQIADPPILLYIKGDLPPEVQIHLAVVGARRMTHYGQMATENLCKGLAEAGVVVVSGLARGIDTIAHSSTLNAGGTTIAVLGSGLNVRYPPENRKLFEEIPREGAIVSEFPINAKPLPYNFPRRNRIISGLCRGVLVTEAASKSGSLITASLALDQNRNVYAVPGRIVDEASSGTNRLIQDGATPITIIEDILTDISMEIGKTLIINFNKNSKTINKLGDLANGKNTLMKDIDHAMRRAPVEVQDLEQTAMSVLKALGSDPVHFDELTNLVDQKDKDLYSVLMDLEFQGLIRSLPGMCFVKETVFGKTDL